MQIISSSTVITNINSTRFLGLIIDSSLAWKDHIIELISKLHKTYYTIRAIKPFMSLDSMKMTYYSYVQSVMSYGIIFWDNSHLSGNIFKVQKRIKRIITNSGKKGLMSPIIQTTPNIATSISIDFFISCFFQ